MPHIFCMYHLYFVFLFLKFKLLIQTAQYNFYIKKFLGYQFFLKLFVILLRLIQNYYFLTIQK